MTFAQFMHNGSIAEFGRFKRRLQSMLPDEIFNVPQGNTGRYFA
jgi:glutamine amidotransferase